MLVATFGRPVTCRRCGLPLARTVPLVRRGRVWTPGLELATARVLFTRTDEVAFEHVDAAQCPAQ